MKSEFNWSMRERVWSRLEPGQRKLLIFHIYPNRAEQIVELESRKQWKELLPSTQQDLRDVNWSEILSIITKGVSDRPKSRESSI